MNVWMADWERFEVRLNRGQGVSLHPENHSIPESWFSQRMIDYDFWFVTNGQEKLIDKLGNEHEMRRGTALFFLPHSHWSCQPCPPPAKPLQLVYFHFDLVDRQTGKPVNRAWMEDFPTIFHCHEIEYIETTCRRILQLGFLWKKEKNYRASPAWKLAGDMLKTLIRDVVLQDRMLKDQVGMRIKSSRYQDLLDLMSRVNDSPANYASVEEMAASLHMSTDHLTRQFRRLFGKSPVEALIESRIDRAKTLLGGTGLSIADVAENLGYGSVHYFSRQFKDRVGKSPLQYRQDRGFRSEG